MNLLFVVGLCRRCFAPARVFTSFRSVQCQRPPDVVDPRDKVAQSWARSHIQRLSEASFQTRFNAHFAYTQKKLCHLTQLATIRYQTKVQNKTTQKRERPVSTGSSLDRYLDSG